MELFFSELDKELIETLKPLAENQIKLFYPFFANTFPLAFHYYQAIRAYSPNASSSGQELIIQVPWTKSIEELITETKNGGVFYAIERDTKKNNIDSCCVCTYQPKSIFIEHSPDAFEVAKTIEYNFGNSDALKRLVGKRKYIDICSDIPQQAKSIINALKPKKCNWVILCPHTDCNSTMILPPQADCIRLYLYGGPLTTYLHRMDNKYIELNLPPEVTNEVVDDFRTHICINPKNEMLKEALCKYHKKLFSAAAKNKYDELWAITNSYNRLATSQQHQSSFISAQEYVECLKKHQNYEDGLSGSTEQVKPSSEITPSSSSKPLVLFGCGDLSIGLVLPSLNPSIPKLIVIVEHDKDKTNGHGKNKIDWEVLFSSQDHLILKNELGYNETYDFLTKEEALATEWSRSDKCITYLKGWSDATALVQNAGCVATSLGPGLEQAVQFLIRPNASKIPLLLFENRLPENIKKLQNTYDTQHVICDRICQDRELLPDHSVLQVKCESYAEIIVLDKYSYFFNNNIPQVPFSRSVSDYGLGPSKTVKKNGQVFIRLVSDKDALELYRLRKRWLMNSIQYLSPLLAIDWCMNNKIKYDGIPATLSDAILEKGDPNTRACLEVFIHCQIGRMLLEGDGFPLSKKVLGEYNHLALYENLRLYVENNRKRCNVTPDMITRLVTEGKATDKYKELLDAPFDFYRTHKQQEINQISQMFSPSGNDITLASQKIDEIQGKVFVQLMKPKDKKKICPYLQPCPLATIVADQSSLKKPT